MYVRRDKDCNLVSPQPGNVNVTDVYGNTFENWCVDFVGRDKDNATNSKTGCAPQDPEGLIASFVFHNSDNSVRTPSQYVKSPLIAGTSLEDAVSLEGLAILGLEEDRDLILYNASNTQSLQLEDSTQVLSSATFS